MEARKDNACCFPGGGETGCRVEAVVSIDERGQMVLPKDVRERAGIQPGDKFTLITWEKDGEVCCLSLIRVERLASLVKNVLEPVIKEVMK